METAVPDRPGTRLDLPPARDVAAAEAFVRRHLGDLVDGEVVASPRFRGGQMAADAALATLDITGYAAARNEVWPEERRGASAVSPYVRHGLLQLPLLWEAVADAPGRDRAKYRDELLWQEYARHLYARVGTGLAEGLRHRLVGTPAPGDAHDRDRQPGAGAPSVWDPEMACLATTTRELVEDGYLVNQTRMWLASHWAVREGVDWRDGEEVFFRHLLDGSRAANRAGWQWTVGTATGRPYGFSRWQVTKRAPGLCDTCPLADDCPIEDWPEDPPLTAADEPPGLRRDLDVERTAGPRGPEVSGTPELVWVTAESLGDDDPALMAHPDLPAVFVFDAPLLARLRLSGKRLVFLTETLADLAERREVQVHLGDPVEVLAGRALATTFAPVPGWRRRSAALSVVALHPWPWLRRPHGRSAASFSAWRKAVERSGR
ncbi:MAG: deoxyribodipyrimidine photolyase [Nitriliruptor sp.]|nr:MAG: deoxyribodipyrimidine photolyase [Nitriliruptor sp.]